MKKWLAVLLCIAMLVSACALAESLKLGVSDVQVIENGQAAIDLTGLDVELRAAALDEENLGVRLSCAADGRELACAVLGVLDGKLVIAYGNGAPSNIYYLDVKGAVDDATWQQLRESGRQVLESIATLKDPTTSYQSFVSLFKSQLPAEWITGNATAEFNGESCEGTLFEVPEDVCAAGLRAFAEAVDGVPELRQLFAGDDSLLAMVEEEDGRVEISGGLYQGSQAEYLDITLVALSPVTSSDATFRLIAENAVQGIGEVISVKLTAEEDGEVYGLAGDIVLALEDGDSWLRLDLSDGVDLATADADALEKKLQGDVTSIAGVVMAGALNVMYSNQINAQSAQ